MTIPQLRQAIKAKREEIREAKREIRESEPTLQELIEFAEQHYKRIDQRRIETEMHVIQSDLGDLLDELRRQRNHGSSSPEIG